VIEQLEFIWNLRFGYWDLVWDVCFQTEYLNSDRFKFIQSFQHGIVQNDSPLFVIKPFPSILSQQMISPEINMGALNPSLLNL